MTSQKQCVIISLSSNWGNRIGNLQAAQNLISQKHKVITETNPLHNKPVGYLSQPNFYNSLIAIEVSNCDPEEFLQSLLKHEQTLNRQRGINMGPRTIDIDIILWEGITSNTNTLTLPHPAWQTRDYLQTLLKELQQNTGWDWLSAYLL